MPERDEPLELFAQLGAEAATPIHETSQLAPNRNPREEFLTGMLAQWAADDRERGAKPSTEEKRRAREGARAALGEILR